MGAQLLFSDRPDSYFKLTVLLPPRPPLGPPLPTYPTAYDLIISRETLLPDPADYFTGHPLLGPHARPLGRLYCTLVYPDQLTVKQMPPDHQPG